MISKMRLVDHIYELRRRVIFCALFFAAAFAGGWIAAPYALDILTAPLAGVWADGAMLYSNLSSPLMINLSLAFVIALVATLPFLIFQIFRFVAPALHKNEQRLMLRVMFLSPLFFIAGAALVYFFIMPLLFRFFIGFAQSGQFASVLLPDMSGYVSLCLNLMKTFGLAFQFPIVLIVLNRLGILTRGAVIRARRFVWVGMFAAAAVLTPPDIASMLALAVPLIVLFEGTILVMKREL